MNKIVTNEPHEGATSKKKNLSKGCFITTSKKRHFLIPTRSIPVLNCATKVLWLLDKNI